MAAGARSVTLMLFVLAACPPMAVPEPDSAQLPQLCGSIAVAEPDPSAVDVQLCVTQVVGYEDAGAGEDHWIEPEAARPATGHRVQLVRNEQIAWEGWLADGRDGQPGCANAGVPPGDYELLVLPHARAGVGDNAIVVFADARRECWDASLDVNHESLEVPAGGGRVDVELAPGSDLVNVSMVAGWILARHDGGFAEQTMTVWAGGSGSSCCQEDGVPRARIGTGSIASKVAIAHELGHYYDVLAADNLGFWIDCTFTDPQGTCAHPKDVDPADPPDVHTTGTMEWSTCAAREGLADFFAALTWNDPGDEDCWLELKGEQVDCRGGEGLAYPVPFMETVCPGPQSGADPYRGLGVQIDWARTMWAMVAGADAAPSLADVLAWIRDAGRWPAAEAFNALDAAAWAFDSGEGSSDLYERWSVAAQANGIDHPG